VHTHSLSFSDLSAALGKIELVNFISAHTHTHTHRQGNTIKWENFINEQGFNINLWHNDIWVGQIALAQCLWGNLGMVFLIFFLFSCFFVGSQPFLYACPSDLASFYVNYGIMLWFRMGYNWSLRSPLETISSLALIGCWG